MLNLIEREIASIPDRETKIHITREYLQLLVLKILYDRGYYKNLAFIGGTALRFLYGLRRFSEDLDFSLISRPGYKFDTLLKHIAYDLEKSGLSLDIKKQIEPPVQSAMFRFKDILFQLGLSNIKSEKLSIKLEVDTNPPKSWKTATILVSKHFVFTITTFDIASLYALKLHACFYRKYTKGRDFYDLLWYLGRKETPNYKLLNNAIKQTEHKKLDARPDTYRIGAWVNPENFRTFLKEKLAKIDFDKARRDVARFIEDKKELKLIDKDTILRLL